VFAVTNLAFCDPIHEASKAGDLGKVQALVKENPRSVFSKDSDGRTPLHWAVLMGYPDVCKFLLSMHADVNATDKLGHTPLHEAAMYGRNQIAILLLANKARVNAMDDEAETPLTLAIKSDHDDLADLLRQHRQEPGDRALNSNDPESAAWKYAVSIGSPAAYISFHKAYPTSKFLAVLKADVESSSSYSYNVSGGTGTQGPTEIRVGGHPELTGSYDLDAELALGIGAKVNPDGSVVSDNRPLTNVELFIAQINGHARIVAARR
jgi:hypothetical protein